MKAAPTREKTPLKKSAPQRTSTLLPFSLLSVQRKAFFTNAAQSVGQVFGERRDEQERWVHFKAVLAFWGLAGACLATGKHFTEEGHDEARP